MKKKAKIRGYLQGARQLDTVGVVGSIPISPTISKLKQKSQIIEIPQEYEVIPAIEWRGLTPRLFRVLIRKTRKRIERGSNSRGAA